MFRRRVPVAASVRKTRLDSGQARSHPPTFHGGPMHKTKWLYFVAVLMLMSAACNGDDDTTTTASEAMEAPTTAAQATEAPTTPPPETTAPPPETTQAPAGRTLDAAPASSPPAWRGSRCRRAWPFFTKSSPTSAEWFEFPGVLCLVEPECLSGVKVDARGGDRCGYIDYFKVGIDLNDKGRCSKERGAVTCSFGRSVPGRDQYPKLRQ